MEAKGVKYMYKYMYSKKWHPRNFLRATRMNTRDIRRFAKSAATSFFFREQNQLPASSWRSHLLPPPSSAKLSNFQATRSDVRQIAIEQRLSMARPYRRAQKSPSKKFLWKWKCELSRLEVQEQSLLQERLIMRCSCSITVSSQWNVKLQTILDTDWLNFQFEFNTWIEWQLRRWRPPKLLSPVDNSF